MHEQKHPRVVPLASTFARTIQTIEADDLHALRRFHMEHGAERRLSDRIIKKLSMKSVFYNEFI